MKEIAEILKAVAWPAAVISVVLLLRAQALGLLAAFTAKVANANPMKLRAAGVAIELACEVARGSIVPSAKSTGPIGETEELEFERLANEYHNLHVADLAERVAIRHRLADRLGQITISLNR